MYEFSDERVGAHSIDPSIYVQEIRKFSKYFNEIWAKARSAKIRTFPDIGIINDYFVALPTALCITAGTRFVNAPLTNLPFRVSTDLALVLPSDKDHTLIHALRPAVNSNLMRQAILDAFLIRSQVIHWIGKHFRTGNFHHFGPEGDGRPHAPENVQTRPRASVEASRIPPWFFFVMSTTSGFQNIRPVLRRDMLALFSEPYQRRPSEFRVQLRHFLEECEAPQSVITAVMGHNTVADPNFGNDRWWTLRDLRDLATPLLDRYTDYLGFRMPSNTKISEH